MKAHCTLCLLAACAAGLSSLAATNIESGVTVTITDATVADYAGGINFVDATGVVAFDTTYAPTMDITGAGTVKKISSSGSWTMSKPIPNFSGDYILEGAGYVTAVGDASGSARYFFGNDTGALDVRNGAGIDAPNSGHDMPLFYNKLVKLAGYGPGSQGVIRTLSGGYNWSDKFLNRIQITPGYNARLNFQEDYNQCFVPNLDLNGRNISFLGNGKLDLGGGCFPSNGTISVWWYKDPGTRFQIRSRWAYFEATDKPMEIGDCGSIYFFYDGSVLHDLYPFDRPLIIYGTHAWIGIEQQNQTSPCTYANLQANLWKSPITLNGAGTLLKMRSTLKQQQFNVTGSVGGTGSLTVKENYGRVYLANTNNTYGGYTYVDNYYGSSNYRYQIGQILAAGPHSIPNYASLTGRYGTVALRMKARESEDEVLWTDGTYIRDLANEGTWLLWCGVGLDTTFHDGLFTLNYPAGITNTTAFVGGAGPGDILMTNAVGTAESPIRVMSAGGTTTVKTKPGAAQYLGGFRTTPATYNSAQSVLCFQDCDLIQMTNIQCQACQYATADGWYTSVQLKNTRLVAQNLTNTWKDLKSDALTTGSVKSDGNGVGDFEADCGVIEIFDGSVVTSRLVVGGIKWGGRGTVIQHGGSVAALGSTSWDTTSHIGSGLGANNFGYYELRGGDFTSLGRLAIGNLQGGYFAQFGGTFKMRSPLDSDATPELGIQISNGDNPACGLYVAGGTFDASAANITLNGRWAADGYAFLFVEGEDTLVDFGKRCVTPNYNMAGTSLTLLALADGGRFRLGGLRKSSTSSDLIVNFNGGIWECGWSRAGTGGDDIFQIERKSYPGKECDVFIYAGGMTVDTAGAGDLGTFKKLTGAYGGGVTGITSDFVPFQTAWRPAIKITGDGKGASAVALWDRDTGLVSGIKVLAPGVGYTAATVSFYPQVNYEVKTATCTIAANANEGSFTKTGEGDFFFAATNTYGGATIVKEGTLKGCCDWAFPTNTAIVLAGGNVDFGGKTGEVSSVTYKVGVGQILNAENVALPSTSICEISTAELAAGQSIALSGDVDLSKVTVRVTGDVSALAANGRYDVVTTTGAFTGTPTVELDSSFPSSWRTRVQAARIRLVRPTGIVEVLR